MKEHVCINLGHIWCHFNLIISSKQGDEDAFLKDTEVKSVMVSLI